VRAQLETLVAEALSQLDGELPEGFDSSAQIGRTRDARHGDFTTNLAMRLAKPWGQKPRDLAEALVAKLPAAHWVEAVTIAGPGFINFKLAASAYQAELGRVLEQQAQYGHSDLGRGTKVLVEYVSANPTGPLHVGHGRHAAYGATLANLLAATGHEVHTEYYVNDSGRQMNILGASVWIRYAQQAGVAVSLPAKAYQGDYVSDIAITLQQEHNDGLLLDAAAVAKALAGAAGDGERELDCLIEFLSAELGAERFRLCVDAALDAILGDIQNDMAEFRATPERWYSERGLVTSGALDRALEQVESQGHLYQKDGATWFKATDFGDDQDRVVVRDNGVPTYFASDIAYHFEKRERGFDVLLDVLGADHHGYIARVKGGLEAMGEPGDSLEVRLIQFVALFRGTTKIAMGTRSGEYVTLRDLRAEVGNDAARFFYVMRSNEQHLDFDMDLAASQSDDNPVYYVQYACARVASILRRRQELGLGAMPPLADTNLELLQEPQERALLINLSRYPEIVELAATNRAPQHMVHYLRELAATFHTFYNAQKVLVDDGSIRDARTFLAVATQQVLANGLGLLGVSVPEQM
jgi:arginyl-tRNA synthetase